MENNSIVLKDGIHFEKDDVVRLYQNEGWTEYIKDSDILWSGILGSLFVSGLYEGKELVGFCRLVGDGQTVIVIQDLIIAQRHKKKGYGKMLVEHILDRYPAVRQKIILCDDEPDLTGFYEKMKFEESSRFNIVCMMKF